MLTTNLKKVLKAFKEKLNVEVDKKISGKLNNTFIEKPNRILTTDANGKVVIKDVGQQQLDYITNVSSDVQAQLDGKTDLDHLHPNYATKEELNIVAGKDASTIVFDSPTDSFEADNVQDALEEVSSKVDSTINNHNNDINNLNTQIKENKGNISNLQASYVDKNRVGIDIAELEMGKLKINQLPDHTHTDYVEHTHIEFNTFASKEELGDTNKLIREHNHNSDYSRLGHTHQDIIDMIENANVEGELASLQTQIKDNKTNISENTAEISNLKRDKAEKTHTHSQFSDLQEQIDNIELVATQHSHPEFKELQDGINANTSTINGLGTVYASKTHNHDDRYNTMYAQKSHTHDANDLLDGVLPELDKKYAPTVHIHPQYSDSTHDHDSRYAKVVHSHTGEFAPTNHDHQDYAFKIHDHSEFISLDAKIDTKANKEDVFSKEEITVVLDNKSDITHNHSYSDLTDIPNSFKPDAHSHITDDIDGLEKYVKDIVSQNSGGSGSGGKIYEILEKEGSFVVDATFPYGHIMRYGGVQRVEGESPTTTTNHTAIQNSISIWNFVYIPRGEWVITSAINLKNSGSAIIGDGMYSTILLYKDSNVRINVENSSQRFEGLTIKPLVVDTYVNYGFYTSQSSLSGLLFKNVEVRNVSLSGFYAMNASVSGDSYFINFRVINQALNSCDALKFKTTAGIYVLDGRFYNVNSGVYMSTAVSTTEARFIVKNNTFLKCNYGVRIQAFSSPTATILIESNIFKDNQRCVFVSATTYNLQVVSNIFQTSQYGLYAGAVYKISSTSNFYTGLTEQAIMNKSSVVSGTTRNLISTGDIFNGNAVNVAYESKALINGF